MVKQIKTNHSYVMFFVVTFLFGSTIQGGWALSECGQVGLVLDKKLGWNAFSEDAGILNNLTIVISLTTLGMSIGSYFGGLLLPKFGSRKLMIIANIVSLMFNLLKLIENTAIIMAARLAFGVTTGITAVCLSRTINDTVPAKNAPLYGAFVNAGFNIGVFFSNFMGLLIPMDNGQNGDVQKMMDDGYWRLVFGMPIIFQVYTIVALLFIIKHESIL